MALGRRDEPFAADRRRLWIEWSAAAIFSAVLLLTLIFSGATGRLDDAIYDFSIKLHHLKPRSDVVIVAVDAKSLQEIGPWPWSRATQAELIRKVGLDHPRAMAYDFLVADPGAPADDEALRAAMLTAPTYLGTYRNPAHTERPWITYEPFPQAAKAAAGLGPMDADMDALSVVRRTFLFQGRRGRLVPIAMLQMAQLENMGPDVSRIAYPASGGDDPLYKAGEFLIPFVGPLGTIHRVSAGAVLRGLVPDSTFRGKLVLIGPTAPGLLDTYQTPTSTMDQMPNVEIQANILNGILSGNDFVIVQKWEVFLLSATLIAVLLFALVRLGPRENLLLSVGLAVIP
ncbi:MAG: CHASE2 domain-containing protein, partial [Alphaproteobacteria bacterium]|nr:CHASE2 domain-containing protein [Alphaproteobacteria bacterium]